MKSAIAILSIVSSFSVFGMEPGSVDALLSVLPLGTHSGVNDSGEKCSVMVSEVNFPSKALSISAINANNRVFKKIMDGSEYLFRAYKQEFIQSDRYYVDSTRSAYVDRVIRTVNAGSGKLYVVIANEVTVNRDLAIEAVDCVINF